MSTCCGKIGGESITAFEHHRKQAACEREGVTDGDLTSSVEPSRRASPTRNATAHDADDERHEHVSELRFRSDASAPCTIAGAAPMNVIIAENVVPSASAYSMNVAVRRDAPERARQRAEIELRPPLARMRLGQQQVARAPRATRP